MNISFVAYSSKSDFSKFSDDELTWILIDATHRRAEAAETTYLVEMETSRRDAAKTEQEQNEA